MTLQPASPPADRRPTLSADGLGMRFGRRVLFRNLALHLEGGESLAVTGANGSGKSTLLAILAGLQRPTKGGVTLELGGTAVPAAQRPHHVGLAGPYLGLWGPLTGLETLVFLAEARGLQNPPGHAEALLARVGLGGRGGDAVSTYSSGMQQRLRLATALVGNPTVLLLDEPSATLDDAGRTLVALTLQATTAGGGIVILATNDGREAALADRTLSLEAFA